jgi:hypothetical protein
LPIVEHGGGAFGYRTEMIRFPQQRFTVITLCNLPADPASLSRKVADIYLKKDLRPQSNVAADPTPFAGTYFDSRTHYLTAFTVSQGHLVLEGHALQAVAADAFEDPVITGGTVSFSKAKDAMKATVTYNHAITFAGTRINGLHLDSAALRAYVGTYKSYELDAIYKLTVEDGNLVLRTNWKPEIKLQPVVPGEFNGGGISLSFHTDARNRITGLTVFSGWDGAIRNENFDKLN